MNKKMQRIIVIVLTAALLLSVVIPALSLVVGATVTQSDIQGFKDELARIQAQKKETENQLAAVRNDLAKAREQMELIESQVVLTEALINASQDLLDQYDLEIAGKEQEIQALEEQEQEQLDEFYRQVRWMEETGSVSYVSILFEASSFQELLEYAMLLTDIMEYSNRIIDRLQATQAEIAAARDELQASRDDQAAAQEELETQKAELETQRANQNALLQQIAASESKLAEQARMQAASEERVNRELKDAEAKWAAQLAQMNNVTTGSWYWPLPGQYKLSSLFGGRILYGYYDNHTGTDIPAGTGTPIYAANDGIVTSVNSNPYASSYGNYCIISHGSGYATLYAHQCQAPVVREGQTVSKGQLIGYVGSTGNSTGPHLHFELRVNGVRGNVLKLYPGMTFTTYGGAVINGG